MVYPILLPPLNNLVRSHKRVHENSLKWLLAGLNFHKATRLRQMIGQNKSLLAKVLECMCFGWVQGTSVAEMFTILLFNIGGLYQVKYFTPLKIATLIKLSLIWGELEEIWLWEFSWHKNHVKNILQHQETCKRMLTAALFKTRSINSGMDK